jgi:hypothetical protein
VKNYSHEQELFIREYFTLSAPNHKGWMKNLSGCPYCHDGASKNPRSYFIFDNDEIGFHCFNCGAKHRFTSKNINSLAKFISLASWKKIGQILLEIKKKKLFPSILIKNQEEIKEENDEISKLIDYKEIKLPNNTYDLFMNAAKLNFYERKKFKRVREWAFNYLEQKGVLDIAKNKKLFICLDGEYKNRLIIPIYFDDKLISFSARALFNTKNKYLYPPTDEHHNERSKIIYNLEKLIYSRSKRIYITESIIDAWILDGMSVLSKNLSNEQIKLLEFFNKLNTELIFVLDKDTNINKKDKKGLELGLKVFETNNNLWKVSFPKFKSDVKDVSDSYKKYGFLETFDEIFEGIIDNKNELMIMAGLEKSKSKLLNGRSFFNKKRRSKW